MKIKFSIAFDKAVRRKKETKKILVDSSMSLKELIESLLILAQITSHHDRYNVFIEKERGKIRLKQTWCHSFTGNRSFSPRPITL